MSRAIRRRLWLEECAKDLSGHVGIARPIADDLGNQFMRRRNNAPFTLEDYRQAGSGRPAEFSKFCDGTKSNAQRRPDAGEREPHGLTAMRADSALQRRRPPVAAKFDGAPVRERDRPRPKERHVRERLAVHGLTDRAVAEEAPDRLALHGEARGAAKAGTVLVQGSPPLSCAASRRRPEAREPPVEVGLQILDVLEADAEANRRAAGREARRGAGGVQSKGTARLS